MADDIDIMREAIALNRQQLLDALLQRLGYTEVDAAIYDELLALIEAQDTVRMKYIKALESQEIVEAVLKDKLL